MKASNYYKMTLILICTFVFALTSCAQRDEKDFKNLAKQLKQILSELDKIKSETKEIKGTDATVKSFLIDMSKKIEFVAEHDKEFMKLAKQFKLFINNNPKSRWTDDAAFCLAVLYLSRSYPGNNNYLEAIEAIRYYILEFPDAKIDNWTLKTFKNHCQLIFDEKFLSIRDPLRKAGIDKRIKGIFKRLIVVQYLYGNKIFEAEKELKFLEKSKDKDVVYGLKEGLDSYKKGNNR